MSESKDIALEGQHNSFMDLIASALQQKDLNPESLSALLDTNERVMDRQAKIEFTQDMAKLRSKLQPIIKNKKNGQTNSMYADYNAIKTQIEDLLNEFGFNDHYDHKHIVEGDMPGVETTCILSHKGGHERKNKVFIPMDNAGIKGSVNKTGPHAMASSMMYGKRLSLSDALGLSAGEDRDGNRYVNITIDEAQYEKIKSLIDSTKTDEDAFCKHMGVDEVLKISSKDYAKAVQLLKAKENKNADKA